MRVRYHGNNEWYNSKWIATPIRTWAVKTRPVVLCDGRHIMQIVWIFIVETIVSSNILHRQNVQYITTIRSWKSNHIHGFMWDIITHACSNLCDCSTKPLLMLRHEWLITTTGLPRMWLLFHDLIVVLFWPICACYMYPRYQYECQMSFSN